MYKNRAKYFTSLPSLIFSFVPFHTHSGGRPELPRVLAVRGVIRVGVSCNDSNWGLNTWQALYSRAQVRREICNLEYVEVNA